MEERHNDGRKEDKEVTQLEETFARFASEEHEHLGRGHLTCAQLSRGQRARLHELAEAAGFVHYSIGKRHNRVLVITRNPRPITPAVYDPHTCRWSSMKELPGPDQKDQGGQLPNEYLKVLSYNVLMDYNSEVAQYPLDDVLYTEFRWPALLKIIDEEQADLIALQEATPTFHTKLMQEEWVQRGYYVSGLSGDRVSPMGNLLLSRYPFISIEDRRYKTEPGMPKSVLLAVVAIGSYRLSVAVVHLKAGTGFAHIRKSQIEQTIDMQQAQEADGFLLMGDFNMRDIGNETNERLDKTYTDLWQAVHGPIDPSRGDAFTFDLRTNSTAKIISDRVSAIKRTTGSSSRFDRMYFRPLTTADSSPQHGAALTPLRWEAADMKMIGKEPIHTTPEGVSVFPSDHYGLVATLVPSLNVT